MSRAGVPPRLEPLTPSRPRVFLELPQRLMSLDAFRGFVMLAMVSGGLGLHQVARQNLDQIELKQLPRNVIWEQIHFHTEHVLWEGCSFWDLIQPSFMFMVGVAMAFSNANRRAVGQSYAAMFGHALLRAVFLILLGVFLRTNGQLGTHTNFVFVDVVSQIGLGYVFLFLVWGQSFATQLVITLAILISYWCFFFFHALPPGGLVIPDFGHPERLKDYIVLEGIRAPWNIHINSAADFDRWFLNLFPPHNYEQYGGYQTLNFIPSLATMIFGLMAGEWLRKDYSLQRRCLGLLIAGAVGIGLGYVLHITGVCPVIKKIWTPSWAIYSAGWASLLLGVFFFGFDVINLKPIAWPLTAVGRNSLAIYILHWLCATWLVLTISTHFSGTFFQWIAPLVQEPLRTKWTEHPPPNVFHLFGDYRVVAERVVVLLSLWAVAIWMYRRKLFLKI